MKLYIFSLSAGVLVGVIYSLLSVRSPAPPLAALLGLLGMLVGEQVIPVGKQLLQGTAFNTACAKTQATDHVLGQLPGRNQIGQVQKSARQA
jgi:XapX domain-containing protein